MTIKAWKNLKSGDVIKVKNYYNYWIVKSIGYGDLPIEEYTNNDYVIEVSEYERGNIGGTIFNHYQVDKVITDPIILSALKYGVKHSDDYLSFVSGVEWAKKKISK